MTFSNYKQVEAALDITLTAFQAMLVQNYLDNGVRPPATNCSGCDEAYVRKLTGRIDAATAPDADVTELVDVPRKRRTSRKRVAPELTAENAQEAMDEMSKDNDGE